MTDPAATPPPEPAPTEAPTEAPIEAQAKAAAPTPPAEPAPASAAQPAPAPSRLAAFMRRGIVSPIVGLGGIIIGAIIGLAIEAGAEATGVLGPGVDVVIAQQAEGFARLDEKLEALRNAESPESARQLAGDLRAMLDQQRAYAERTADELRGARAEIDRLKQAALEQGSAVGADLWLKPGESATIGTRGSTFALVRFTFSGRPDDITVNATGDRNQRMTVGQEVAFESPEGAWRVVYKQAEPRADGRVGFDVVPPG